MLFSTGDGILRDHATNNLQKLHVYAFQIVLLFLHVNKLGKHQNKTAL